jgi:hypothetical protein
MRPGMLIRPVGWRRPCSQLRSVPTSTSRSRANFDWLSPVIARISFTFSASTKNSREGVRSPRRISSCCCMLSTSRSKSFLSIVVRFRPWAPIPSTNYGAPRTLSKRPRVNLA